MSGWYSAAIQFFQRLWSGYNADRTWALLLAGAAAFTAVALVALSRTKWGRAKPLVKCVVISVVAHVWLLMYAYGTKLSGPGNPNGSLDTPERLFMLVEDSMGQAEELAESSSLERDDSLAPPLSEQLEALEPMATAPDLEASLPQVPLDTAPLADFAGIADDLMQSLPTMMPETNVPLEPDVPVAAIAVASSALPAIDQLVPSKRIFDDREVPQEYLLRNNPNRLLYAQPFGASQASEEAVARGLRWLAGSQLPDGSWSAQATGAGRENRVVGSTVYQGIGRNADTGLTGLALLAFLSAGHTHAQGEYSNTVRKGLEYLVAQQLPSGDLSGRKQQSNQAADVFARMYCHGIAAFALSECYAMTGDPTLLQSVTSAAGFTIKCQDPISGGWRYVPQDKGDLSQFGWQALALRSAHHGGLDIPTNTWTHMDRFLDSVAGGTHGGLGKYRPQESPTTTMTAEKLACHLLLEKPLSTEAEIEAQRELLQHLPGIGDDNVYYWYYGTLAMFQFQDKNWQRWNDALQNRLIALQEPDQSYLSGSWPPDRVWGGYGGRVYSTAMSCLCLEVYYRYLPLYHRSNLASQPNNSQGFQR